MPAPYDLEKYKKRNFDILKVYENRSDFSNGPIHLQMSDKEIKQYAESDLQYLSFWARKVGIFYGASYIFGGLWGSLEYIIKNKNSPFVFRRYIRVDFRVWAATANRSHHVADNLTFFALSAYGINLICEKIRDKRDCLNTTIAGLIVGCACRLGSPRPVILFSSLIFGSIGFGLGYYLYGLPNGLYRDFIYRY